MKEKFMNKDFVLVVIGQIISLFGNSILRFALPLYLLNETKSIALFGMVSACAFVPMILLCPIGGIVADRVNKRNIMVALDTMTAVLTLLFTLFRGTINLVALMFVTLICLYGIQGAYQPTVQASIPALLSKENLMKGNAVINLISSVAGLIGPVIGGAIYGFFGITPILYVSIVCFALSAFMEIFIQIPFLKKERVGSVLSCGYADMKESFHFMWKERPEILKVTFVIASVNLFLSALMTIGMPVVMTQILNFEPDMGNRLYGYREGAYAAGSLLGGCMAGVSAKKFQVSKSPVLLFGCALTLFPIGLAIILPVAPMISFGIIIVSCVVMMFTASMFSVQMMVLLQMLTPEHMIGKVISCAMCIGMCAQPVGQAVYSLLFSNFKNQYPGVIFFVAAIITIGITMQNRKVFVAIEDIV